MNTSKIVYHINKKNCQSKKIKVTRVHRKVKYELKQGSGMNNLHVTGKEL